MTSSVYPTFRGSYDLVIPRLYQGSLPDVDQEGYYDPFDVVVVCVGSPAISTFLPPVSPNKEIIWGYDQDDLYDDFLSILMRAGTVAEKLKTQTILCVCTSGMNRSGVFAVLTLYKYGYSIDRAIELVQQARFGIDGASEIRKLLARHKED